MKRCTHDPPLVPAVSQNWRVRGWTQRSSQMFPFRCWTGTVVWPQRRSATTPGASAATSSSSAAWGPSPRTADSSVSFHRPITSSDLVWSPACVCSHHSFCCRFIRKDRKIYLVKENNHNKTSVVINGSVRRVTVRGGNFQTMWEFF